MSEIEIKGNTFFVVDTEESKWILDKEGDAIEKMKEIVKGKDIDVEKIAIFMVDTKAKEWKIKQVSWSKIAIELIRGE